MLTLKKYSELNQGFSIVPSVGLNFEYGRFSTVNEDGDMALKVKSDDYYSIKPKLELIQYTASQCSRTLSSQQA